MTRLVLRDPTTGSIRAVLETAEPYVAEGRSHMSHGTSGPPTQGPREIDGASDGAHSPTAASPVFRVDPTTGSPSSSPTTRECDTDSHPDDEPDPFTQARKRRWAELIRHVWLDDPEVCERCGGHMRIAGVCTSPRDDDAIRQELEARGKWDPPWARAPPGSDATPTSRSPTSSDPPSPDPSPDRAEDPHLPEPDPWDDECVPDPWAEEEGSEETPDSADTAIDPSEDPDD